jgi:hypothetical protein
MTEIKIEARGELRSKMNGQAERYRGNKHETAHEVLTRQKTNIVLQNGDEADAVLDVLERVSELEVLSPQEQEAAKRIRTELITAPGDFILQ